MHTFYACNDLAVMHMKKDSQEWANLTLERICRILVD